MSQLSSRLSTVQKRALLAVERMETSVDGVAHDHSGDLSACSGNWPATASALVGRRLIERHFVAWDEPYEYTLTPLGSETCVALRSVQT